MIIFMNVFIDMDVWWDEIFGLVVVVVFFSIVEEVIVLNNDIEYGLLLGIIICDEYCVLDIVC